MNKNTKEVASDIYEKLLESQIDYLIYDDPMENYTHLTDEEKDKVKEFVMDQTHLWDYAPIAEFITENVPTTFHKDNFERLFIQFDKRRYIEGKYPDSIEYRLYQDYLLDFEYGIGNVPVCYDEFKNCELQSEDYLNAIDGVCL